MTRMVTGEMRGGLGNAHRRSGRELREPGVALGFGIGSRGLVPS